MVEVDPLILVAAGSAVFGLATIAICMGKSSPSDVKTTTTTTNSTSKPTKKKSKSVSKNVKSSKPIEQSTTTNESKKEIREDIVEINKPVISNKPAIVVKEEIIPVINSIEKEEQTLAEESEIVTEEMKKNKKAKETPEQKASRLERQKNAKVVKKVEIEEQTLFSESIPEFETTSESSSMSLSPQQFDGWAVVEEKRKLKTKKPESEGNSPSPTPEPFNRPAVVEEVSVPLPVTVSTPATVPTPVPVPAPVPVPEPIVIPTVTSELEVEVKKLGLLIGPKGVTKIGIQNATGVEINMPKADKEATGLVSISVTGEAAGVKKAVNALNELILKGYTTLLTPEDFVEGSVTVQSKSLPDIIGKNGSCIKAIQLHTGVKITTPPNLPKADGNSSTKVKIGLAGLREQVSIARNLILDITKYYHTPVTHPTLVHKEIEVQGNYYNFIIGPKGSEIKHIQANYKVSVHIPNENTHHQHVLVVGEPANVDATEKHILKLVEKADAIAAERALAAAKSASGHNWQPAANGNATNPNPAHNNGKHHHKEEKPEERAPGEEWMDEFTNRPTMALSAMLPADFGSKSSTSTSSANNAVNSNNSLSNENPTPAELSGKANADTNGSDPLALRNRGVWDR